MILALFLLLVSTTVQADCNFFVKTDWQISSEDENLTLYSQKNKESDVISYCGVAHIKAPPQKVASVVYNMRRSEKWQQNVSERRMLQRISKTEALIYFVIATPFFMDDRDFIIRAKFKYDSKRKRLSSHIYSEEKKDFPPRDGLTRAWVYNGGMSIEPHPDHPDHSKVSLIVHADARGDVPTWIVNLIQKNRPSHAMSSIREQISEKDFFSDEETRSVYDRMSKLYAGKITIAQALPEIPGT